MEAHHARHPPSNSHAIPAAPYSLRAPSPPFIHISVSQGLDNGPISITPSFENIDPSTLTPRDLEIVTQNKLQVATDRAFDWSYEQRREAQPIVDFLYLGPNSVVRNHDYLQREGITMVYVARDARMSGTKLVSVEKAAQKLNVDVKYLDIEGTDRMIGSFQEAIRVINDHLLTNYHSQAQGKIPNGDLVVEPTTFRPGKVLVTCESGNERSAAVTAAYIMAVFGKDMTSSVQFISIQRFCCCFDEDIKRKLQSWEDILKARSQVAAISHVGRAKRHYEDMQSGEDADMTDADATDVGRFEGRENFVPFLNSD